MMRNAIAGIALALAMVGPAQADPISSADAQDLLFTTEEMVLEPRDLDAFSRGMRMGVRQMMQQLNAPSTLKKFLAAGHGYYGALVFPKEGVVADYPTYSPMIVKLHSPEAAEKAAVEYCQSTLGVECAVAALLLPAGYEERDLTLNFEVTERVEEEWSESELPRYLAISPSTSNWGVANGPLASARTAIESCKEADCVVVIADKDKDE